MWIVLTIAVVCLILILILCAGSSDNIMGTSYGGQLAVPIDMAAYTSMLLASIFLLWCSFKRTRTLMRFYQYVFSFYCIIQVGEICEVKRWQSCECWERERETAQPFYTSLVFVYWNLLQVLLFLLLACSLWVRLFCDECCIIQLKSVPKEIQPHAKSWSSRNRKIIQRWPNIKR